LSIASTEPPAAVARPMRSKGLDQVMRSGIPLLTERPNGLCACRAPRRVCNASAL